MQSIKTKLGIALAAAMLYGIEGFAPIGSVVGVDISDLSGAAYAASDDHGDSHSGGHSGGGRSGRGGPGGPGGSGGGHDSDHDDSGHDVEDDHGDSDSGGHSGGGHSGRGGHSGAESDRGRGHDSTHGGGRSVEDRVLGGGRPVWAQEGIPEVELGRLNVGRAPGHVLARAEQEAISEYTDAMAALYNLSAEDAAALLAAHYRDITRIDSPLQNLALYKDVMTFGQSQLPGLTNDPMDLAAIFLGSASDKTIPISEDTVIAINRILGLVELSPTETAALAGKANTVREAILIGHGDITTH